MNRFRMKTSATIGVGLAFSFIAINANATENMYQHENWSGAYFGLHFGSGGGNVDTSMNRIQSFTNTQYVSDATFINSTTIIGNGDLSGNASGSIADLFIGYNFHLNSLHNFIFGGQLEGTFFSDITLYAKGPEYVTNNQVQITLPSGLTATTNGVANDITQYSDELQSMFTFLVRAGYLVQPNILLYVLGGGVEGNFVLPSGEFFATQRNLWKLGYTAGIGLEYRFNDNWSMLGEYRFIHFDMTRTESEPENSLTFDGGTTFVHQSIFKQSFDNNFNFNMGKIGIVYRFDSPRMLFK